MNAEDGVREAGALQPDLILLDHQLPGTTGFEVCQSLLAAVETKSIPVVVSSTLRKKAYAERTATVQKIGDVEARFLPGAPGKL